MSRLVSRPRAWLLALAAAAVVVLAAGPAAAQSAPTVPWSPGAASAVTLTSEPYDLSRCVSALPPPDCGQKPQSPGDRGGSEQLLLFGIMAAGSAFIGVVIARSTIRNTRARDAAARAASAQRAATSG